MKPWSFKQIKPQKARGTLREEMWKSPAWVGEIKEDGDRRLGQICNGILRLTGCKLGVGGTFVEKTQNVPHISGSYFVNGVGSPAPVSELLGPKGENIVVVPPPKTLDGTVLDGEMVISKKTYERLVKSDPGGLSKYVTSIMGSAPDEALRKQFDQGFLVYVVFDCLYYRGADVRDYKRAERFKIARQVVEREWQNPYVHMIEQSMDKRALFARSREGIILKHEDHTYGEHSLWVKVKKEWTADVVITGFKAAKKESKKVNGEVSATKYAKAGMIGAIRCGQFFVEYDEKGRVSKVDLKPGAIAYTGAVEVATISGIDDALRADMTKHPKKYIGRVVEIEHNGREKSGRFRHPRFKRFRDDKEPRECVYRREEI
jgi:ATP-dependent DNA ligase